MVKLIILVVLAGIGIGVLLWDTLRKETPFEGEE
jgi:hypothetical protein